MYNLVLVDTSAWICFFARKGYIEIKQAISELLDDNRVAITGPVMVELIQGTRMEKEKNDLQHRITGLNWLHISDEHWHKTAELAFALRRRGVTVTAIDSLLAVVALSYNCSILHKDGDFGAIAKHSSLKIYNLEGKS